LQLAK